MSQAELAQKSGVCLATIQNLESGRNTNPSIQVIEALLNAMGFKMQWTALPIDWDLLSDFGVPLSKMNESNTHLPRNAATLSEQLRRACLSLLTDLQQEDYERKLHSVQATLWAIKTHYHKIYQRYFAKQEAAQEVMKNVQIGKVLKLRRVALGVLCQYL